MFTRLTALGTGALLAVTLLGSAAPAAAQTTPETGATPAPQASTAPSQRRNPVGPEPGVGPRERPARVSRREPFSIEVSPFGYMPTGSDQLATSPGNYEYGPSKSGKLTATPLVSPGTPAVNQIFFDGQAQFRITSRLRAFYRRVNHASIDGKRNGKYGGGAWDLESQEGLAYGGLLPGLTVDAFYRERHRIYGSNNVGTSTPRFYTGVSMGVTQVFGGETIVGRPYRLYVEATDVDHHLDAGVPIPPGQFDLGKHVIYRLAFRTQVPVYGQNKVVPYFEAINFEDYFNNNLQPSHTNRQIMGVAVRGTRYVGWDFYVKNDHQYDPLGDVPHNVGIFAVMHLKYGG